MHTRLRTPAGPSEAGGGGGVGKSAGHGVPGPGSPGWPEFLGQLKAAADAHAIIAVTDAAGNITSVNDRFIEVSGYAREELIGKNHRILKSGVHSPEFFETMWRTIASGRIWRGEICNRAKSGRLYWVDSTIVPVLDSSGQPFQYIALRTEITRLKDVEEELSAATRNLEKRIEERTAELARVNAALQVEMAEHRRVAEQVAQSESLYRLLFQSVTDYFYTVEVRDGVAVQTTHTGGCAAVTGYTEEDFSKEPMLWISMVVAEDREMVQAQADAALHGHTPPPLEHRIVRKDGELRWIRNTVVIRRDASGRVAFYDGIISDITASRLAQEEVYRLNLELEQRVVDRTAEVKARSEQFRLLFEHAPLGISWVEWGEPDTYHLNERFCQIIGLTPKEAERFENIMAATHPEDRPRQRRFIDELAAGRRDRYSMEKRYVHKDGRVVWANLVVVVLRDSEGRLVQQFSMTEDITERREAEERLRRSELRFRRFVENANEILYSLTPDGHYIYVSPTWTTKLGHAVADVTGQPFSRFVHPDDLNIFWDFLRHVLELGRSNFSVEYRMMHWDGYYRWHASSGSVYYDDSGDKLFMGVARDITERKRNQEELKLALARQEEMARIVHRSPSIVVLWRADTNWPVEFVSKNVDQFGYTVEEVLSGQVSFGTMLHPGDRERVEREVRAHASAAHREYRQEYRILTRDGQTRWIDDRTVVRFENDGRVTHHEGILTDITERKEAEQREVEAHERDLRTAREVQRHLLPDALPEMRDLEVDSLYQPSRHIGGDYYDFFEVAPRRWMFVVADVSGKGASAALVMTACRTALRIEARRQSSPGELLKAVNALIHPDMPEGMFISIVCALVDLEARTLVVGRAGHEAPLVIRKADGSINLPSPSGLALGLDGGAIFDETLEEQRVPFAPGDLLVLYTDGITEVVNDHDEEYGRERLAALIAKERNQPLPAITRAIEEGLRDFAGTQQAPGDDRTLVLVRTK